MIFQEFFYLTFYLLFSEHKEEGAGSTCQTGNGTERCQSRAQRQQSVQHGILNVTVIKVMDIAQWILKWIFTFYACSHCVLTF